MRDPHFEAPALYVYDSYPGGSGLSEAFLTRIDEILGASLELVRACPCEEGCPSCVGPRDPEEEIDGNPKAAVDHFLASWLGDASGPGGESSPARESGVAGGE